MNLIKQLFSVIIVALLPTIPIVAQPNDDAMTAPTSQKKAVQQVNFIVNMSSSSSYTAGTTNGMYTLSTTNLTPQLLIQDNDLEANAGGVIDGNTFYYQRFTSSDGKVKTYQYDLSTYTYSDNGTARGNIGYFAICSPAYDKQTKRAYAMYYHDSGYPYELAYIDYNNWTRTTIAAVDMNNYVRPAAMAATNDGRCYAIGYTDGALYSFNKQTGAFTKIGETGFIPYMGTHSACIYSRTNKLYWAGHLNDNTYSMIEVDLSTGVGVKVGTINSSLDINVMAVEEDDAAANVPNGVVNFKAINTLAAMNDFSISFDLPSKTFAGNTLTGTLNYDVKVDGATKKTGSGTAGQHVSFTLNGIATGSHEILVNISNAAGKSPDDVFTIWSGPDFTAAPTNAHLTINGNQATVTWDAPAMTGIHGGLVDPSKVTYAIMQLPEQSIIAQGLTSTSWTGTVDISQLRFYTFLVKAIHQGQQSTETNTERIKVGEYITPPYFENFNDINTIFLYTIIDANNDGSTWGVGNQSEVGYIFSETNRANDWLITPPLNLTKGKTYKLSFRASCDDENFPERMEVKMGRSNTVNGMTKELFAPFNLTSKTYRTFETEFTADEDGLHYIGFHAISDAFCYYIWLTDISIEVTEESAPAAPTVQIVNAPNGELATTLHITAPTTTVDGSKLSTISRIEVTRNSDNKLVGTVNSPQVGATYQVNDVVPNEDKYTYTVVAYNSFGRGEAVLVSTYIGRDYPAMPKNFRIVDNGDNTAFLLWDEADGIGERGGFADPSSIVYRIYPVIGGYLQPQIDETTDNTYDPNIYDIDSGERGLIMYAINAYNDFGESQLAFASLVIGDKELLPYKESYKGSSLQHLWWFNSNSDANVSLETVSSDNDGGSISLNGYMKGDVITLMSGKIDMTNAVKPKLVFHYKTSTDADGKLSVVANVEQSAEPVEVLKTIDLKSTSANDEWTEEILDISSIAGANYTLIGFQLECNKATKLYLDDINLYSTSTRDFAATINAPMAGRVNTPQTAVVEVSNLGADAASDYTVQLVASYQRNVEDGQTVTRNFVLGEQQGKEIAAFTGKAQYRFDFTPSVAWADNVELQGVVNATSDQNTDNNIGRSNFLVVQNDLPTIDDLTAGAVNDPVVNMEWSTPSAATVNLPMTVFEDFEDTSAFPAFSVGGITETERYGAFGDWMLYDGDAQYTYISEGAGQYANAGERMAWQVLDSDAAFANAAAVGYTPHSGSQILVSMCPVVTGTVGYSADDWIVSPELSGKSQLVTFYTKIPTLQYGPETYEIYYSDTDKTLRDFKYLASFQCNSTSWEQNGILLPDGAKHFAIHHSSLDVLGLLLDDITYEVANSVPSTLSVVGYRIYVDDERIAEIGTTSTQYDTPSLSQGIHSLNVSVLYGDERLESPLSNTPRVATAIQSPSITDVMNSGNIVVYNTHGQIVAAEASALQRLPQGVYIVKNRISGKSVTIRK